MGPIVYVQTETTATDITEDLKVLYDSFLSYTGMASRGFCEEDELVIVRIGTLLGLELPECGSTYWAGDLRLGCSQDMGHAGAHGKRKDQ